MVNTQFHKRSFRLPLYKIVNKQDETISFRRNPTQEYLEETKKRLKKKFGRVRLIILKGRQAGITTHEAVMWLDQTIMRSNQNVGILAHTDDTRKSIFAKVKFAFKHFPSGIQLSSGKVFRRPKAKYDSKYELTLLSNDSRITVVRDPRGQTRSKLHISEMAFINNAGDMLAQALPSIPETSDIIIETTANGFGNDFEILRSKYKDKGDNREWTCLFLPWYMVEEYQTPLDEWEIVALPIELKHLNGPLWNGYTLSDEQKKRYLETYNSYTDPRKAFQEYPSTPNEAFLTTGNPVFDSSLVKSLVIPDYTKDDVIEDLYIYRPYRDEQVTYGGDVAAGIIDGDNGCIIVRDRETAELMACYYGICEPSYLCQVIDRLIDLWYWGRIGVERNNHGHAFYEASKDHERTSLLYMRQTQGKKHDYSTTSVWRETNSKTRPIAMAEYKQAIRKWHITEIDPRIQDELFTFIYNEKMKEVAQTWHHDDGIMADAIGWQMRKHPIPE